ncbi:MAG: hypothetical protein RKE49_01420 [Oceanicaulis sp.]
MGSVVSAGAAIIAACLLAGCAGNIGHGRILKPFPVTPHGVEDALAFARDQTFPTIVIQRGLTNRRRLTDPYLNDDGDLCWRPSNAPERCYALEGVRRLYVGHWGYSAGEAVGDAATAAILSPVLAVRAMYRADERADARRYRAAREAERAAFAERFGASLPRGLFIPRSCTVGPVEPDPPAPDACLAYDAREGGPLRAAFFANLLEGGWRRVGAPAGFDRFVRIAPNGARRRLEIETLSHVPDPEPINRIEIMSLRLSDL